VAVRGLLLLAAMGWFAVRPAMSVEPYLVAQLGVGELAPPPPEVFEPVPGMLAVDVPAASPSPTSEAVPEKTFEERLNEVLAKPYPDGPDDLRVIQQQVERVLESALPATVGVEMDDWSGSGVVVSAEGLVLTAGHVVGQPDQQAEFIFPDGTRAEGKMLGINRELDCGMMQITKPAGPWPFLQPAEAGTLKPGDWVIATGQPSGYQRGRTPPVRLGRVLCQDEDAINTDCTLVAGDSGGPLVDMQGRLVGIHSRIGELVTSNLHVPIGAYHNDWYRLLAGDMWGGPLDAIGPTEDMPLFGLAGAESEADGGFRVTQVFPGYPAARAGVQPGDIILSFDRQPVRTFPVLGRLLGAKRPGERVELELMRGDQTMTVRVMLGRSRRPLPGGLPERRRRNRDG
jgi:serine protease Do